MACGLANRMFQYSFYKKLLNKGYDAKVDFFTTATLAHENVDWNDIFPNATFENATDWEKSGLGIGDNFFSKVVRKLLPGLTRVKEMKEAFSLYDPVCQNDNSYLLGVFQNAEVTKGIEEELRGYFRFPKFTDITNLERQKKYSEEESVAIHVRKGIDYQKRIWYQNTCPIEYYRSAVEVITRKLKTPKFYIFTDNPEWVRENFGWLDYELVEGNPTSGWGSHFDMQLMSLCRHNIISNSTYSWWSAFLNANPDKIVIIPKIWFNPEVTQKKGLISTSDNLVCRNWISL